MALALTKIPFSKGSEFSSSSAENDETLVRTSIVAFESVRERGEVAISTSLVVWDEKIASRGKRRVGGGNGQRDRNERGGRAAAVAGGGRNRAKTMGFGRRRRYGGEEFFVGGVASTPKARSSIVS